MNNTHTTQVQDYSATITILEHLSDAIFILSEKGHIEYANKSALDMLGVSSFELINKSIETIVEGDNVIKEIKLGRFNETETEFKVKDLSVPVSLSFGVVKNGSGKTSYIITSARDISWRKEMERILDQKQMMAMSKSRFKEMGELTVNMVHNLSQPLTSLRLKLELLQREIKQKQISKQKIESHVDKMAQLLNVIDSTIDNARRFANQTEDQTEKIISLKENLDHALDQMSYEFTENDIEIVCELAGSDYSVMANPITLQQVFVTLLRMQMKHLVNTSSCKAKRKIVLKISDNQSKWLGILVTAHCDYSVITHIPEVEELSMQESYELDLKVVKLIAETLGGDFNWYPQAQNGFIFSMRIPIDLDDERSQLRNMIELFHDG
ncbi:MAG: PAS domain S-box protein [Calditrichaeota bacterium]|nr:MAG: PAS domain S-box protein [Calditrichota bacterium]MBL1204028.1 PAS domain S-box protein [Calditrichota bacterium]NOG43859.1 PAS domain S-box protein [Calditrichota bacterium]